MQSVLNSIRIVLVEPSHPGNIGASARAMKNMDIASLYLVAPQTPFPNEVANQRSSGAVDILNKAVVVPSLAKALEDCHLVFGTSSRDNRLVWPHLDIRAAALHVKQYCHTKMNIAFVFGRERCGLYNEELQMCHYHVSIPTSEGYASLNLAQAVQVVSYELFQTCGHLSLSDEVTNKTTRASVGSFEYLLGQTKVVLEKTGFLDPRHSRQLLPKLRRLLIKADLDNDEVNILNGFMRSVDEKL